jgi:tRNA pseudouridine55 synthase
MSKRHKDPISIPPLVFNVKKPIGQTSFSIVNHFKKNLPRGYGKIGHFGTLDPFAEGVLMIGVAGAARLNDYVHAHMPKTYIAKGILGIGTPTGDFDVEEDQIKKDEKIEEIIKDLNKEKIQNIFNDNFIGEYLQSPPAYSAVKHKGKPLYRWAREGVEIKKEPVKRYIHEIEVLDFSGDEIIFKAKVGSGTYIRTLFTDFAKKLSTYGALRELNRTSIGHITTDKALEQSKWPLNGLNEEGTSFDMKAIGYRLDEVLPARKYILNEKDSRLFRNGVKINFNASNVLNKPIESILEEGHEIFWVYDHSEKLIGLASHKGEKLNSCFNIPQNV